MLYIIILLLAVFIGGYFAFRYISLIYAMENSTKDLERIQQDLTQNQMLHLPVPNEHLKNLLRSFNNTLEEIQRERQRYDKREKEFQKQIENISHDLRTPITVILGFLKLLKSMQSVQLMNDKELIDSITIIQKKAEVMNDLIAQFYDYSRLQANDYQLSLARVDVARILRESLVGNYQVFEQAHLEVEVNIPERPVWVLGEIAGLNRVFLNLFQNAGRYADSFFRVRMKEGRNGVVISFVNDARDLVEEDIPQLFQRFYTPDASRLQGGTGLGLTIARKLAEEMNGSLSVVALNDDSSSENEEKTIVRFEICLQLFS